MTKEVKLGFEYGCLIEYFFEEKSMMGAHARRDLNYPKHEN